MIRGMIAVWKAYRLHDRCHQQAKAVLREMFVVGHAYTVQEHGMTEDGTITSVDFNVGLAILTTTGGEKREIDLKAVEVIVAHTMMSEMAR